MLSYIPFKTLPDDSKKIRIAVFVEEQKFTDEFDSIDPISTHIVAYIGSEPVGTCRIFCTNENETYHVGRLAVLKEARGSNVGKFLMNAAETEIQKLGGNKVILSAQMRVRGFYEKLGYTSSGEVYLDQHCPHINMIKLL